MGDFTVLLTFGISALIPAAFFIFIIVMIIKFYRQHKTSVEIQRQQLQENLQFKQEINDLKIQLQKVENILKEVE